VDSVASACAGLESAHEIERAIDRAAESFDLADVADALGEALIRGAMLGATDSLVEREEDEDDPLAQFTRLLQRREAKSLTGVPFADAIRLFEERQILPRPLFDQLTDAAKQKAFTIAGLASEELLSDAHDELARQLRDSREKTYFDEASQRWVYKGPDLRQFDKFVRERLEKAGWVPASKSHVETVLRTNVMAAYSSGGIVERTQPAALAARPYWQIVGVNDSRQRKTHRDAQGTILSADHPFWRKAYPPFGFNCRCRVVSRSKRWVDARGGPTRVPVGLPDKGFASGIDASLVPNPQIVPEGTREPSAPTPAHEIDRTRPPSFPSVDRFPRLELPPRPDPMPVAAHSPLRSTEPHSVEAFKEAGIHVEGFDKAQEHAKAFFGAPITPQKTRELIGAEGLLPGAKISYRVASNRNELFVSATVDDALGVAANIERSYKVEGGEKTVHHHLLWLPERLQNSKFGSNMFAAQLREYLKAGVHRVETEAAWVGQYYWPSIGYQLRSPSFLGVLKYQFIEYANAAGVTESAAIVLMADVHTVHDLAMTKIGGRKIGKEFLLNRGNAGGSLIELELDLTEGSQSRAILKERLGI